MFKRMLVYNLNIILLSFILLSCEEAEIPDNLLDPSGGDYTEVEAVITDGPNDGSTITSNSATFSYTGGPLVVGYSHRMDFESNTSDWSDWVTDTVVTYENLDEGQHTFHVRGKYSETDIQLVSNERSFTVNAVSGPSIRVFPQTMYSDMDSVVEIDVYAEELGAGSPVSFIKLEIRYDSQILNVFGQNPISEGDFLSNYSGMNLLIEEIETGSITVNIGVAEGTSSTGLIGTGILFSISLESLNVGESAIEIYSPEFRDAIGTSIDIQEIISGSVVVE